MLDTSQIDIRTHYYTYLLYRYLHSYTLWEYAYRLLLGYDG